MIYRNLLAKKKKRGVSQVGALLLEYQTFEHVSEGILMMPIIGRVAASI